MHHQYREVLRHGVQVLGEWVEQLPSRLIDQYNGWRGDKLFLPVEHDLMCGDGKCVRSFLSNVGVSCLHDVGWFCKCSRADRHLQLPHNLCRRFGSFPGVSVKKQNELWRSTRGDKEKQEFLRGRAGITGEVIWACDEICYDSGNVSSGSFHVSTFDKRVVAIVAMIFLWNGCLEQILKHWHDCVKVGGNFEFDHWSNGTLSIKFADCEKLRDFMELSYDKLFTCTSANCVGRACRHQQAHSDSCISIDNPDAPLEVGDVITHRRSFHPGVVVTVPQDPPNRVFIHFDR